MSVKSFLGLLFVKCVKDNPETAVYLSMTYRTNPSDLILLDRLSVCVGDVEPLDGAL
jgi:hypothetical protein